MRTKGSTLLLALLGFLPTGAYADYAAGLRSAQAGDYVGALREWLPPAGQGDARAQQGMCTLYSRGDGVQQSYEEALKWCRKAADQGNAAAQNTIGTFYHFGRGVQQDDSEATSWYQKAASQGNVAAQNNLGYRYLKGGGVSRDYVKAEMWFSLSGPGTDQADAEARAEVAAHLAPEQMAQALRLAQEWRTNRTAERATVAKPATQKLSCPQPGAAAACNSFTQLVEARDESILRSLEPISYVCFHENEDIFFTLRVAPLLEGFANYPTAMFFSEYRDGVSDLGAFVQGMWTRDIELKESIFKSSGAPSNKATDKAEIDGLEVFLQYAFKNQLGSSTTHTVQIRRSTGRFTESISSPGGRQTYSGSCARFDTVESPAASGPRSSTQSATSNRIPQASTSEIDKVIQSGKYSQLPRAQAVARLTDSGPSHLSVLNQTVYTLTVTFYGPTERSVTVDAGQSLELDFAPGTYRVLGRANSPTVLPFVGSDEYSAGTKYESTFYVTSHIVP
jgi:hypothetical protein